MQAEYHTAFIHKLSTNLLKMTMFPAIINSYLFRFLLALLLTIFSLVLNAFLKHYLTCICHDGISHILPKGRSSPLSTYRIFTLLAAKLLFRNHSHNLLQILILFAVES